MGRGSLTGQGAGNYYTSTAPGDPIDGNNDYLIT